MENIKGLMVAVLFVFLGLVPMMIDMVGMSVSVSQLNKVGAEMIQVVASSTSDEGKAQRAVELAEEKYGVEVVLDKPNYQFGETVNLTLTKEINSFFGGEEVVGMDGRVSTFTTSETVMITKRD